MYKHLWSERFIGGNKIVGVNGHPIEAWTHWDHMIWWMVIEDWRSLKLLLLGASPVNVYTICCINFLTWESCKKCDSIGHSWSWPESLICLKDGLQAVSAKSKLGVLSFHHYTRNLDTLQYRTVQTMGCQRRVASASWDVQGRIFDEHVKGSATVTGVHHKLDEVNLFKTRLLWELKIVYL